MIVKDQKLGIYTYNDSGRKYGYGFFAQQSYINENSSENVLNKADVTEQNF